MDPWLATLKRGLKHAIAGAVFIILLVGGTAMVLSAIAVGISSLAAAYPGQAARPADLAAEAALPPQSPAGDAQAFPPQDESSRAPSRTGIAAHGASLAPSTTMYSPLGAAIDEGGVVIGNHIQRAFGSLLSGLLQTLFLEQPGGEASGRAGAAGMTHVPG
ncbi:hypothetical protein GCM10010885_18120 [Alicyclobacillus cellulosilyticus]|uniref:Uncharacterized protein n=1 Tax=Alicyclobacillus cellulosilyticus TaxID=1003997 RepID=A0A917KEG3_9BACL|nr:hypothetical protein [Alicyclobacillus cellulosilyticus]GGJ09391.1 hypothetical protein GCM10010885_18120 [Alicyclobacillus cellulosilyticus]